MEEKEKDKDNEKNKKHVLPIVCAVLLVSVLAVYGGITYYYHARFLPGTVIGGLDSSNLTAAEVVAFTDNRDQKYVLTVMGRDQSGESIQLGTLACEDIGLQYSDVTEQVEELLAEQNQFLWFVALFGAQQTYQLEQSVSYDEAMLKKTLRTWDELKTSNMEAPKDAYIGEYSAKEQGYAIVPHTMGNQLKMADILECVGEAILTREDTVDLQEAGCYAEAKLKADDSRLNKYLETANKWVGASVTYDWHGVDVTLDGEQIHEWITFDHNKPALDEEAVQDFISSTAAELDTYGKKRTFTTTYGTDITIVNSRYGWKVDRTAEAEELLKTIYAGNNEKREPVYSVTAVCKGSDDIGSSYVEIDLSRQHLYLYQDGAIALESDFVSGNMSNGNGTPGGIFGLTYKTRNAVLRGDNYETPVSYWMPFNGNIGMHDATWRWQFGGEIYLTSGSHGCINLPLGKAKEIYEYVSTGFPVICYY